MLELLRLLFNFQKHVPQFALRGGARQPSKPVKPLHYMDESVLSVSTVLLRRAIRRV